MLHKPTPSACGAHLLTCLRATLLLGALYVPAVASAGVILFANDAGGQSVDLTTHSDYVHFVGSGGSGAAVAGANGLPNSAVKVGSAFSGFTETYGNGTGFGEISVQDNASAALLKYGAAPGAQSRAIWFGDYGGTTGVGFNLALPSASGTMDLYMGGFCGNGGTVAASSGGVSSSATYNSPQFCGFWGGRFTLLWSGQTAGDVVQLQTTNKPLVLGPNPGDHYGNSGVTGAALTAGLGGISTLENAGSMLNALGGSMLLPVSVLNRSTGSILNSGVLGGMAGQALTNGGFIDNKSSGNMQMSGLLEMLGGSYFQNSGQTSIAPGATLKNSGDIDNMFGGSMAIGGAAFNNAGAYLGNGGLLSVLGGASLQNHGMVDNWSGGVINNSGTILNALGGAFGNAGTFNNHAGGLVVNEGTFSNTSSNTVNNAGVFSVPGVLLNTVTGAFNNLAGGLLEVLGGGSVVNDGVLTNAGQVAIHSGAAVTGGGSYLQTAGSTQVDGLLAAGDIRFEGGSLEGSGMLASGAPVVVADGAWVLPGGAGNTGQLAFAGGLDLAGDLLLDFSHQGGASVFDTLLVQGGGLHLFDSTDIYLDFDYAPQAGMSFVLFLTDGLSGLDLASWHLRGVTGLDFRISERSGNVVLSFLPAGSDVPEPGTWALLLAALCGLMLVRVYKARINAQAACKMPRKPYK